MELAVLLYVAGGLMMGLGAVGAAIGVGVLVDAVPMIAVGIGLYTIFAVG